MPKRENKATIQDSALGESFRQGFEEGLQQVSMDLIYELVATFEGTDLRRVQFSDLDLALHEARTMLLNGGGISIQITCSVGSTPPVVTAKAVASGDDATIEEAEIVDS